MPSLIVFDDDSRNHLFPLTLSRPIGDLRIGILTIREKWEKLLGMNGSFLTDDSLRELFPVSFQDHNILVNGSVVPDEALAKAVLELRPGQAYQHEETLIAACLDQASVEALIAGDDFGELAAFELEGMAPWLIKRPADIFTGNDKAIRQDFSQLTTGRSSASISETNTVIGPADQLFVEPGASIEACTFNVTTGPIYVGKDAVVLEGGLFRGPIAICEGGVLKMGAKIYGATTVGPRCKVGGEVNNVVFHSNSNKGHDGYLGNAVIGKWCNIGADTNASNLKNDYGEVRVWDYVTERFAHTGLQFHGLVMGDHSKVGINTMLNTGTVIGFSANVFGEGFPRTFIPSFIWGGANGVTTYRLDKALATADRVLARRGQALSEADRTLFTHLFELSAKYRKS